MDNYNDHNAIILLNIKKRVDNTFEYEGGLGHVTEGSFHAKFEDTAEDEEVCSEKVNGRWQKETKAHQARPLDQPLSTNRRREEGKASGDTHSKSRSTEATFPCWQVRGEGNGKSSKLQTQVSTLVMLQSYFSHFLVIFFMLRIT